MSLSELILKCKQKDRNAREWLYKLYSGRFFSCCLKYSGNYEEAKDNLQEGFIKIFENISQFSGRGSFEGWMTRIMINTCLRRYKEKNQFLEVREEIVESPEVTVEDEDFPLEFLNRIIAELPERYRLVFNLYVFEEYSHQEISEILGISVGTSKSNLSRARTVLKAQIEGAKNQKREAYER